MPDSCDLRFAICDLSVSVVVPVHNGAATLPACLSALQRQTFPADRYEVIVVDDGSTDGSADVAHSVGVRVVSQPNAGPAAARNHGARMAHGDIVLFTDADCIPAPDWVERMAAAFATPDVAGAKGTYHTPQRELVARFVQAEYEDKYDRMQNSHSIDFVDTYSAGYRRDVFLEAGGFDTTFPTASVEDQEFSFRLSEAGHRLVFVPHACVGHIHDRTIAEYARRKFWIGYWKVQVVRAHPGKLVRDSHTPQVVKLQMALAALGAVLLIAGLIQPWLAVAGLASWALLVLSGLPFMVKLLQRDPSVLLIAPGLLFVRAWALGLGFLLGSGHWLIDRFVAIGSTFAPPVLLLAVYFLTLAPTITWAHYGADGGDLVTAVVRGSVPHPPGFPTYLLLGTLFIRLPWGEPAWRLNLMSAVLAAGAAGLTAMAVRLLLRSEITEQEAIESAPRHSSFTIRHSLFATCAGLCLGLAPLLWSQALIAEVYAPATFFAALVIVLALRGGPPWALGLAWGVGLGVHPTLVFLAPLVAWRVWNDQSQRLRRLIWSGLLVLLGWGMMYGPVLLARGNVPSPWVDVSTPAGWWALVSGRLYHGYLFKLPLTAWPQRLLAWVGLLARQFTPLGVVLAGIGWGHLWRWQRSLALALALACGAFSLYAIGYNTTDSLVHLVPALPLAVLWLGVGLAQAVAWLERRLRYGAWLLLLLPLLQALLFWGQLDLSGDRTAMTWAEQTLRQAPPHAMLLTAQDAHTFTLWYVHDALNQRPDVVVVDRDLWGQEPYRRTVVAALGLETAENGLSPEEAARRTGRPIVEVTSDQTGHRTGRFEPLPLRLLMSSQ